MQNKEITLGSLFDGIGGFPYAASLCGIKPLWASEILPIPISITRRHFPNMKHVGDITKLNGAELEPVDIISFGSPCQDCSVANNNRVGLAGKRSGLFFEAIRIIKEMRDATHGKYPRFGILENVNGLLSSNAQHDFRAVLEAFTQAEIPMPRSGRWASAGMVRSPTACVAWRVMDARHFYLAQRRKRCFALADFRADSAGEILFKPKGLQGFASQGGKSWQDFAGAVASGAECTGGKCLTPWDVQSRRVYEKDSVWPTLYSGGGGGRGYVFDYESDIAVINDQGGSSLNIEKENISPTLRSQTHGNLPIVSVPQSCHPKVSGTLCASASGLSRPGGMASETDFCVAYCLQGNSIGRDDKNGPQGSGVNENVSYTINKTDRHATAFYNNSFGGYKEGIGTIKASGGDNGGGSESLVVDVDRCFAVRRLMPIECERLMGFPDNWTALTHDDKPVSDSARYQALGNALAIPCVAFIMKGIVEAMENE